jgi:hypothetical protein
LEVVVFDRLHSPPISHFQGASLSADLHGFSSAAVRLLSKGTYGRYMTDTGMSDDVLPLDGFEARSRLEEM